MAKRRMPRQCSLVRVEGVDTPMPKERVAVFLGEIPNMPGHCVVAEYKSGKLYCGYHTESFVEIPEDET